MLAFNLNLDQKVNIKIFFHGLCFILIISDTQLELLIRDLNISEKIKLIN